MRSKNYFLQKTNELIENLKIPLIDERVYDKLKIRGRNMVKINFIFEQDESIIHGFLGLSEYFYAFLIKENDRFYISHEEMLYILECM
ncbi:MAG: hypothetical protein ACFFAS_20570 [Promethearchaeota archaeon]